MVPSIVSNQLSSLGINDKVDLRGSLVGRAVIRIGKGSDFSKI